MKQQQCDIKIIPIILSGGIGKRLWPLSRESMPKPFLKLYNHKSLLQNTILRCQQIPMLGTPIVVANSQNKFLVQSQLKDINADNTIIIFEKDSCNTAPSVAVAVEYVRVIHGENALLLIMPIDHLIENVQGLSHSIEMAIKAASDDKMILFGVKPTFPSTNYGYIKVTKSIENDHLFQVDSFLEKPKQSLANDYYADGCHYWNSGIYLASVSRFINDFNQYQPSMLSECQRAVLTGKQYTHILELDAKAYQNCPDISLDYAITENTSDIEMAALQSDWYDLGDWTALYDIDKKDENQNVIHGDVISVATDHSYVRSENDKLILMLGMSNCYVIETRDAILIADKNHLHNFQELLDTMKAERRSELSISPTIFKPWGSYTVLDSGVNFQIKKLFIRSHQAISLQTHQFRSEQWTILKGKATVTLGRTVSVVNPNESIFVPMGMRHRIQNNEETDLELIEVQIGTYLGEDDIIRHEDMYVRA